MRIPQKPDQVIALQKRLAKKVITKDCLSEKIKTVCGVDVSYKDDKAFCSAVILDKNSFGEVEAINLSMKNTSPYIPGLFMIREAKPIFKTIKKLKTKFDLLFVDGHGQLHPRYCGLACYVGISLNKPVIGIAKRLLCGFVRSDSKVIYNDRVLGYEVKGNKKSFYVSVGHKISLKTAVKITKEMTKSEKRYPEPLRLADMYSKKFRNSK